MRALSIRAPWWWFILHAGKRIENRDWKAAPVFMVGRTFLIHASSWWKIHRPRRVPRSLDELGPADDFPALIDEFAEDWDAGKEMASHWARVAAMPGALGFFEVPDELLVGATWTKVDP